MPLMFQELEYSLISNEESELGLAPLVGSYRMLGYLCIPRLSFRSSVFNRNTRG